MCIRDRPRFLFPDSLVTLTRLARLNLVTNPLANNYVTTIYYITLYVFIHSWLWSKLLILLLVNSIKISSGGKRKNKSFAFTLAKQTKCTSEDSLVVCKLQFLRNENTKNSIRVDNPISDCTCYVYYIVWWAAGPKPVSYTHLDVYKRQQWGHGERITIWAQYTRVNFPNMQTVKD